MKKPACVIEIFLQPGDFYFGDADTRIRTVLGSCVSIVLWHPARLIGGMCHYMLPFRESDPASALDGRYAEEAMQLFMRAIRAAKTYPAEYRVKLFGAGNMFPGLAKRGACGPHMTRSEMQTCRNVPCKNTAAARLLMAKHGFTVEAEDLGGDGHRQLIFDIWSGHVWVRRPPISNAGAGDFKQDRTPS